MQNCGIQCQWQYLQNTPIPKETGNSEGKGRGKRIMREYSKSLYFNKLENLIEITAVIKILQI